MGFKVYQGAVNAANKLAVAVGKQSVAISGSGDKITVALNPPKDAKVTRQAGDGVIAFINEGGRDIIVEWDASAGAAPVAAPRGGKTTTVATPPPGQWLVTKDSDNISDGKLDGAFQAKTPSGWQNGSSVKFTTSMCGLDNFVVTYRYTAGGKQQLAHVVVTVRKRIHCHLSEMKKSASSADTFDEFRAPIAYAQRILGGFGIDLEFKDGKIEPEKVTPFAGPRNGTQLRGMIPDANAAGRKPTHLWINVVDAINGPEDGLGGQSQVHVERKKNAAAKAAYESWVADWQNSRSRGVSKDTWVNRRPQAERKLARELASEAVTPDDISLLSKKMLLLHEIGHALGLVPMDSKAGGDDQGNWEDHGGHCSETTCVLFWQSGFASVTLTAQLNESTPFTHIPTMGPRDKNDEKKCNLFMRACDLSDLRNLPS
jgi:hypothetical protein